MDTSPPRTFFVEADADLQALSRILDRIAVLQLACETIRVNISLNAQNVVIELRAAERAHFDLLVNRLAAMPCVRSVAALPNDP